MICFSGERGASRHGSTQNGIVGVQPYTLTFSNREYSSSGPPPATLLITNNSPSSSSTNSHSRNSSTSCNNNGIFEVDMKRSYAEDSSKSSCNMPASKIAHTGQGNPPNAQLPSVDTLPKQCKLFSSAQVSSPASIDLKPSNSNGTSHSDCEVFLGGSCGPTSWRVDIAIPMLKKAGITYYNPQVEDWYPELIEIEHHAKHNANLLLFVIDNQTRGITSMAEVAYLVASGKKVILVITGFKGPGQMIMDEPISQSEYDELTRSQLLLQDLVERHDIPVFNDINTALKCTAKVVQDNLRPQDLVKVAADLVQPAFNTNTNIKIWVCSNLKKTFDMFSSRNGRISLTDVANAWKLLVNGKLGPDEVLNSLNKLWNRDHQEDKDSLSTIESPQNRDKKESQNGNTNGKTLNYDEFCRIMSELILCHRNKSRTRLSTSAHMSEAKSSETPVKVGGSEDNQKRIPFPTHDVYLACPSSPDEDNDKWRTEKVIPFLEKHNLSYLDSETSSLTQKLLTPLDTKDCDNSRVVLFNLTESSRAVESMIQLSYYVGLKREIVVCVGTIKDDALVDNEMISTTARKDYNRARCYVADMAKRDGYPVYYNIDEALDCVVETCKRLSSTS